MRCCLDALFVIGGALRALAYLALSMVSMFVLLLLRATIAIFPGASSFRASAIADMNEFLRHVKPKWMA